MLQLDTAGRRTFLLAVGGHICVQTAWALFLILGVYIKALGGNDADVGAIMASFGVSALIAIPIGAVLMDRLGRRPLLIAGGAFTLLSALVFLIVPRLSGWFYIGRMLLGFGNVFYVNAGFTLLADLLPSEGRAKGLGLFAMGSNIGLALGPPAAEWLVTTTGVYWPVFVLAGLLAVAGSVMAASIQEAKRAPTSSSSDPWRAHDAWRLRLPVLAVLVTAGGAGVLFTFVPAYATQAGFAFAPFFISYTGTLVSTRLFADSLMDRPDRGRVVPGLLLCSGASLLLLAADVGLLQLVVSGALFGFAQGVLYPVTSAIVLDLSRPEHRGRAVGLFTLAMYIGANFLLMPFAMVANRWGYPWMYASAAVTLCLAAGYAGWRHVTDRKVEMSRI